MADSTPAAQSPLAPETEASMSPKAQAAVGAALVLTSVVVTGFISGQFHGQEPGQETAVMVKYAAYCLPIAIALAGLFFFVVGSVRSASGAATQSKSNPELYKAIHLLEDIKHRSGLTETIKRVNYRHEDLKMIRKMIEQDIQGKHYEPAMALLKVLGETYGYVEEAEEFRERIIEARANEYEEKAGNALAQLDTLLANGDFDKGVQYAERIKRTYPDSLQVRNLGERVEAALEAHKKKLEQEFRTAAAREDVDRAMDLLKQLDRFLTPQDAEPLMLIAREVISKKKDNLVVQFKLATHSKEWITALTVGEQIIAEFPNSNVAKDVRSSLDMLRTRAEAARKLAAGQQAR